LPQNLRAERLGPGNPFPPARLDLEGIVAKRLEDTYNPGKTKWFKILNPTYSPKVDRAELFERRYG